jgi:hypothetical protein
MVSDFEIPATYSSSAAVPGLFRAAFCTNAQERMMLRVSLRVTDDPPDRPQWLRETIRLVADGMSDERARLLAMVDSAPDVDLVAGSEDDWGLGQVAIHLLIVERGSLILALRLAMGSEGGPTGQPRPAPSAVSREGIASLASKAVATVDRLRAEFPAEPDTARMARHPYYGELNCFGWLLMLPNHYKAHLAALGAGRPSAL